MASHIERRKFLATLGGAAAWPLTARAQQTGKLATIGFLGAPTPSAWRSYVPAFVQRLNELGWIEGRTATIVYRWAEGRPERYTEIAAEFVRLKVDVIVSSGTAVVAAKQVTSVIPIVFAVATDPLGSGLVANLARPDGNVTGLSSQTSDLFGKRLETLREAVPGLRRLAIMGNVGYPGTVQELNEVQAAARALKLEVATLGIRRAEDIAPAFEAISSGADALYVCTDSLTAANRVRIVVLALGARLPTIYGEREHVEAGGLMSYGANVSELFRRAGDFVDKILRGAKPAGLPVEQPTKFDLVINLITAKVLGLAVPPTLLARADEVIE
jgi:putative tryptophan/tyrosine transport system substrate-binding protein